MLENGPRRKLCSLLFLGWGPSCCTPFLPVFITQSNTLLSFPFPQHLSSSLAPRRVPAAPSDIVYLCASGKGKLTIMPVSETSSEMGIESASSRRQLRQKLHEKGQGLNFTPHSPFNRDPGCCDFLGWQRWPVLYLPAYTSL